jgi:hypothetical protein
VIFKHIDVDLQIVGGTDDEGNEKKFVRVDLWFASRKQLACVRTIALPH